MAKGKETFNKRDKEKRRLKEKQEKREKMEDRRANQEKGKSLDQMLAYVDENGDLTSVPPDPKKKLVFNVEDIEIGVTRIKESDDPMKEGRVDHFDESKGFGFIIQSDNGFKVFFHISQTTYQVREGDIVNFEIEKGPKGWIAIGVAKKA